MGLNLKHAQYIMEIIKEGSITNASKTMHVSQPAAAKAVDAIPSVSRRISSKQLICCMILVLFIHKSPIYKSVPS